MSEHESSSVSSASPVAPESAPKSPNQMELARIARSSPDRRRVLRSARCLLHERSQPEEGDLLEQLADYVDELEQRNFGAADGRHEDPADDMYDGDLDDDQPHGHSVEELVRGYVALFRRVASENAGAIEELRRLFGMTDTLAFAALELFAREVAHATTNGQAQVLAADCWRLAQVFVAARPQMGGAA